MLERLKVAVSADEFGTVAGVQFSAVFQFAFVGLRFHSALLASASIPVAMSAAVSAIAASINVLLVMNAGFTRCRKKFNDSQKDWAV